MLVSALVVLTPVPEQWGGGCYSWSLPEHAPQLSHSQMPVAISKEYSSRYDWILLNQPCTIEISISIKLCQLIRIQHQMILSLTFLVMICVVCILASNSANTCFTTASSPSLHFWSLSWLLRATAGPEAVPNRRITMLFNNSLELPWSEGTHSWVLNKTLCEVQVTLITLQ